MIKQILPITIGNALKIFLSPPSSAVAWRLLRNNTGTFIDENDPAASVIYDGTQLNYIVDYQQLFNGTTYFYCLFSFDGAVWTNSAVVSAIPSVSISDDCVDVLSVVRDRIDDGLQNEVQNGFLSPQTGQIPVLNAPPVFEDTNWPLVTVHVTSDGSSERGIGEMFSPDLFDTETQMWGEFEGWLAHVQLTIIGWSKNPDERINLRKALRRIILGNLPVFDSFGIVKIDFSQQDIDELQAYPAPVYQSMGTFSCEAPAVVSASYKQITDIAPLSVSTIY